MTTVLDTKLNLDTIDLYKTNDKLGDKVSYRNCIVEKEGSIKKAVRRFLSSQRYVEATVFSVFHGYAHQMLRWFV